MPVLLPGSEMLSMLAKDFDSDGLDDLLVGNRDGQLMYLHSLASVLPTESYSEWATRLSVSEDGLGDGDRDGKSDLFEYVVGTDPRFSDDVGPHGIEPEIFPYLDFYPPELVELSIENPVLGVTETSAMFPVRADTGGGTRSVSQ